MWKTVKLGDICDLQNGFAFKSSDYVDNSNTLNIRMSNIRPNGKFDEFHNIKFLPDNYATKYAEYKLIEGDLIIAMTDMAGNPKILGMPTIVKNLDGRAFLLNQRVGKLHKFSDEIFVPYLCHFLSTLKNFYKNKGAGGLQINISKKDILSAKIRLPPLAEQQRIVAKLDAAFAEIDTAIEVANAKEAEIKKLGRHALETFFKENFKTKKIGVLGGVKSGGTPKSTEPSYWNGKIEWYSSGELNDMYALSTVKRITNEGLNSSNAKLFPADTLLVGMYDTAAMKMSILQNEATFNQAIVGIPPNEFASPQYLFYALNYLKPKILLERRGVRQQNLSLAKIKNVDVPIPSKEQQQCIVKQANKVTQKIGFIVETLTNKKSQLANLKSAILAQELRSEAA